MISNRPIISTERLVLSIQVTPWSALNLSLWHKLGELKNGCVFWMHYHTWNVSLVPSFYLSSKQLASLFLYKINHLLFCINQCSKDSMVEIILDNIQAGNKHTKKDRRRAWLYQMSSVSSHVWEFKGSVSPPQVQVRFHSWANSRCTTLGNHGDTTIPRREKIPGNNDLWWNWCYRC